ncbi:MAG: CRTAC1 family protein [Acidobacteriota bacterium]
MGAFAFVKRVVGLCISLSVVAVPLVADGGVVYQDVSAEVGISFERVRSPEHATVEVLALQSLDEPMALADAVVIPQMTGGYPGVAIFDYDGDGDLDVYAANGPGAANSLFQSQLADSGVLSFVDVADAAGVTAIEQDSAGVCFGDLDNDGDHDLVVLGRHDENRLFANLGNGTFAQVVASGIEGGTRWSSSCAVGDVDGDGLLDVAVANFGDTTDSQIIYVVPFDLSEHNQLFRNEGGMSFADISAASGFENTAGLTAGFDGGPTPSWAISIVDLDMDGDQDVIWADDQIALPTEAAGGLDRGLIQVFLNDGAGVFTASPILGPGRVGTWMALAFGDLDCNGTLDVYASNFGDYAAGQLGNPTPLGTLGSRWFLGNGDGTFTDPGVGGLISTPFAWGTGIYDYDNDGDLDILAHGGLDTGWTTIADNPGTVMQNQGCSGSFVYDTAAVPDDPTCLDAGGQPIAGCTFHTRRNVRGLAIGDLDQNGFNDVVTLANLVSTPPLPLIDAPQDFGGVLDTSALFVPVFAVGPTGAVWSGLWPEPGDLVLELANDNGNSWAAVSVRGSIDDVAGAVVNRDGIGAVVTFTAIGGNTVIQPILGGSSHVSQHSLERIFGLGDASLGVVEVLWPGGVKNRFYGIRPGERLTLPEIPCSYDTEDGILDYLACVIPALGELRDAGIVDQPLGARLLGSALLAYIRQ